MKRFLLAVLLSACGVESIQPPLHYDGEISVTLLFHGQWDEQTKTDILTVLNDMTPSGYFGGLSTYGLHPNLHAGGQGQLMIIHMYSPEYMPDGQAWHTWNDLDAKAEISVGGAWTNHLTMMVYALSHEVIESIYNPAALNQELEIADECQIRLHQSAQYKLGGIERTVAAYMNAAGVCVP